MKGKTYRAYKLPVKPERSSVNKRGELQGIPYNYNEYTYNKKEWVCNSALCLGVGSAMHSRPISSRHIVRIPIKGRLLIFVHAAIRSN